MAKKKKKKEKPFNPEVDTGQGKPVRARVAVGDVNDKYSTYPSNGLTPRRLARIFRAADDGDVSEQMESGKDVILEIEIQGALKVKERFPDALLLFVTPPSAAELENRLRGRGTESDEVVCSRLKRAVEESEYMENYDYILINDNLDTCVREMHELIQAQHLRTGGSREWINRIRQELRCL